MAYKSSKGLAYIITLYTITSLQNTWLYKQVVALTQDEGHKG